MKTVISLIVSAMVLFAIARVEAEPYAWCNSPFINCTYVDKTYNLHYKSVSTKDPYLPNTIRTTDTLGNVWITEPNPYNKKELRTRKLH